MCIYYRTTFTNKRIIFNNEDTNILTHFKCGHCFECLKERSDEMTFRATAQANDTFACGGFTLFDTLTYDNEHLPHINDELNCNIGDNFSCFRHKDIINFLKLLRIRLQRQYGETKTLTQLYTGEYGTDQGHTHRPHYHIIFYYVGNLNPIELSYLISDCWKYGRTDGVKYKGRAYLLNKRVFTNSNSYNSNQMAYVCKYLQKESTFNSMIKERCNIIILNKYHVDGIEKLNTLSYPDKLECNKLLNSIRQFSRISNNFGANAKIDWENIERGDILVNVPDRKKIVKKICLPRYYIRKKYQNLVYYNIGNKVFSRWEWNEKGKIFCKNKKSFNLKNRIEELENLKISLNDNKYFDIISLAKYECNKGTLLHNEFKSLINYNTPKYKFMYNNEIQLTDKPLSTPNEKGIFTTNEIKLIKFNELSYLFDKDLTTYIEHLRAYKQSLKIERQKHYIEVKKRENFYKYLNLL